MSTSPASPTLAQFVPWLYEHRRDIVFRVVVSVLLIAWLQWFPSYVLTLYLADRGLPPLELVGDDFAGTRVLFTWTVITLVVIGIYLWTPVVLARLRHIYPRTSEGEGDEASKPTVLVDVHSTSLRNFAAGLSGITVLVLAAELDGSKPALWEKVFYLAVFSFSLVVSVLPFIRRGAAGLLVNWEGPALFILLSMGIPFAFRDAVTSLLDSSFRLYRVGGLLPVRVELFGTPAAAVEGRLLLLGRRSVYIEQGEGAQRKLVVVANQESVKVTIGLNR